MSESVSESLSESTPSRHSQAPRRQGALPNTGEQSSAWAGIIGAGLLLGGLYKRRRQNKEEEEE
ncbi:LPXTG cell wall anchor domain-containing protein [Streptococcus suis]|uniref:LPXTG cell wall anchor domain-containing protein n=1 Tax=Streptococcus suis TaxID=1307 RepID=UPI003B9E4472